MLNLELAPAFSTNVASVNLAVAVVAMSGFTGVPQHQPPKPEQRSGNDCDKDGDVGVVHSGNLPQFERLGKSCLH